MTNSRSEALMRAKLTEAADNAGAFDPGAAVVSYDDAFRLIFAFTEPAAAMPGAPEREAIARAAYEGHVKRNKPWEVESLFQKERWRASADAILALIPSHSGETGEVERLRVLLRRMRGQAWLNTATNQGHAELAAAVDAALAPNDGGRDDA